MTYYNATASEIKDINETMAHFFENLPENKTQRTAVVAKVANKSCVAPPVNKTLFTSAKFAHKRGLQLYHIARLMRNNFNSRISPARIRKVAQTSAKIGKYTTIVGTYNNYHEAACAFDRDKPETVENFYLASATLGFELLMFQYSMYYKTAFKANRMLSHRRTYRVVQSTFGDEALGLIMSGSYWLTHGTLQAAPDFVRDKADEMNLNLSRSAAQANQHELVERFVGTKVVPRSVTKAATRCYRKIKEQSRGGGSLFDDAKEFAEDVVGNFLSGEYTLSEVVETAESVNPQDLSKEQMKKLKNCIDKSQSD